MAFCTVSADRDNHDSTSGNRWPLHHIYPINGKASHELFIMD